MSDEWSYRKALATPAKGKYTVRIVVKYDDGSMIQADLGDCDREKVHASLGGLVPSMFGEGVEEYK